MKGTTDFLLRVVNKTWYRELHDKGTYYTLVTPREILVLLETRCGGLHASKAAKLSLLLHTLWDKSEGVVPVFINLIKHTQRKEKRAKVESNDSLLVAVASDTVLGKNFYPQECDDWEGLQLTNRTWTNWKTAFIAAHKNGRED